MRTRSKDLVWEAMDAETRYVSLGPAHLTRGDLVDIAVLLQDLDGAPPSLSAAPAGQPDAEAFVTSFAELAELPPHRREDVSLVSAKVRMSVLLWRSQTTIITDLRDPVALDLAARIAAVVQRRVRVHRMLFSPMFAAHYVIHELSAPTVALLTFVGWWMVSNGTALWQYLLGAVAVLGTQYVAKAFTMRRWRMPGDPRFGSTVDPGKD